MTTTSGRYTVSDGKLTLFLERGEKGRYTVTTPFDPALVTEATTIEEAFEMAYDAAECLRLAREQQRTEQMGLTNGKSQKREKKR